MTQEPRLFDLNIEKILEAWGNPHAVCELIANALDEQVLTDTREVEIVRDPQAVWVIRDYGRGLRYEHFTQNENPEKLRALGRVIGKFGVRAFKDYQADLADNYNSSAAGGWRWTHSPQLNRWRACSAATHAGRKLCSCQLAKP